MLIKNIDDIFTNNYLYSSICTSNECIYQGIMATPPYNDFLLLLIDHCIKNWKQCDYNYSVFINSFYDFIKQYKKLQSDEPLNTGLNELIYFNPIYLFREICKDDDYSLCDGKEDRYGRCCNIFHNVNAIEPIIRVRYPDFPW